MSSSRVTRLAIANFLAALGAVLAFKLALFRYAASGAEGQTSAFLTYLRLVLCLGWDVVSAAMVAATVMAVAGPLARGFPRAGVACSAIAQAIHGAFLFVSYHVAVIVGAPLDKAAIDLMFFYADPTPGGTSRPARQGAGTGRPRLPSGCRCPASHSPAGAGVTAQDST